MTTLPSGRIKSSRITPFTASAVGGVVYRGSLTSFDTEPP
jgi:hypothetical protein